MVYSEHPMAAGYPLVLSCTVGGAFMKTVFIAFVCGVSLMGSLACSRASHVSFKDSVQAALEQADLTGVTVAEDQKKNTITLSGKLHSEDAKQKAGQVAQSVAGGRIIANQISVEPVGVESRARQVESNVDSAIESNYKAALIANGLADQRIRYDAKNGVLTLKGKVSAAEQRQAAQQIAQTLPNVGQVVNQIEVSR
jgi:osmotically-inducible protein OsmY